MNLLKILYTVCSMSHPEYCLSDEIIVDVPNKTPYLCAMTALPHIAAEMEKKYPKYTLGRWTCIDPERQVAKV